MLVLKHQRGILIGSVLHKENLSVRTLTWVAEGGKGIRGVWVCVHVCVCERDRERKRGNGLLEQLEALFICCFSHRPSNGWSFCILSFCSNLSMLPTLPHRNRPFILCPSVCVCVSRVSSFLSASLCSRDADVVGMSWEGAWVYTLFACYIIYPFLLQAITHVLFLLLMLRREEMKTSVLHERRIYPPVKLF